MTVVTYVTMSLREGSNIYVTISLREGIEK